MDCNNFFNSDTLGFDSNLDSLIQADYEEIALPFSSHSQMSAHMNDRVDLSVSEGLGIVDSTSDMKVNPEEVAEMGCDDLDEMPPDLLNINPVQQENPSIENLNDICQNKSEILAEKSIEMDNNSSRKTEINTENKENNQKDVLELDFKELDKKPSDILNIYKTLNVNEAQFKKRNSGEISEEDNEKVKKIEHSKQIDKPVTEIDKIFNKDIEENPVEDIHQNCKNQYEIQVMIKSDSISGENPHLTTTSSVYEMIERTPCNIHKQKDFADNQKTKNDDSETLRENNKIERIEGQNIEILKEMRKKKPEENIGNIESDSRDKKMVCLENQVDRPKKRKHNELNANLIHVKNYKEEDINYKKIKTNECDIKNKEVISPQNDQIEVNSVTRKALDSQKENMYISDLKTDDDGSESSLDTDSNSQFMIMEEYADEEQIASNSDREDIAEIEQKATESERESSTENNCAERNSDRKSFVENKFAEPESDKERLVEKNDLFAVFDREICVKGEYVTTGSKRESLLENENIEIESDGESVVYNSGESTEIVEAQESDGENVTMKENGATESDVDSVVDNSEDKTEVLEALEPATEALESYEESATEDVDEDEDTLVEDDFEDMEDFEVIDADDGEDGDGDNGDEDGEPDVERKVDENQDYVDEDDDILDEDELDAWLEEGVDKQDKNHSKGPGLVQSRDELGNGNYVMRTKHVLKEKGKNPFEFLPEGWVAITHNSGMPVYLHKQSRVCTLARPYFIGKSSARKHETPVSGIPCLQYKKEIELETENQATEELKAAETQDNSTKQAKAAGTQNLCTAAILTGQTEACKDIPTPTVATAQGSERMIGVEDLHEYCKKLFEFQDITVKQFRTWEEKRSHMRRRYENSKILLPKMCGDTKLIVCPIPGTSNKKLSKKRKDFIMNPLNKSPICVLHEYTQHVIKIQPKYTFSEIDNQETPYKSTITIDGIVYGTGLGSCKKKAKADAAKKALDVFIPQLAEFWKGSDSKGVTEDLSYFEEVTIEDPRVMHLCDKAALPKPFQILNECLKRNFGLGDTTLRMDKKLIANQKTEFSLTVGKHTVAVHCKNKKEGRQLASQAMLQKLHPHLKSWASILKLYSKSTELGFQDREEELPQRSSVKNFELLEKLKSAMRKTRITKGLCNASNFVQSQSADQILDL